MRHRIHRRKLNRTSEHRKALHRHLAQSLFEHGQITTTLPKAKDVRPFCERLITMAVNVRRAVSNDDQPAALAARRRIHRLLGDRCVIPSEHQADYDMMSDASRAKTLRMRSGRRHRTGEPKGRLAFTAESLAHRLIEKVAPRFEDRPGGYTRIIRLSRRRVGDSAPQAILQLVGDESSPGALAKPATSARQRRADARYALAIQALKHRGKGRGDQEPETQKQVDEPPPEGGEASSLPENADNGESQ